MQGILLLLIVGHLDSLLMAPMTSPSLSLTAKGGTLLLSSLVQLYFTMFWYQC